MGAIEPWLHDHQFDISTIRFFESDPIPELKDVDWIIIMGGPMSVNDEQLHPWLVSEKEFIRQCIAANKVVLGICLGAQLIASALGCRVYKNNEKEIGWFPLKKNKDSRSGLFTQFPNEMFLFHWHGETFDLPEGAELIASSEACRNQVYCLGNNVIGLQCHLESTLQSVTALIQHCRLELLPGPFIQQEQEMTAHANAYIPQMQEVLGKILDNILHR